MAFPSHQPTTALDMAFVNELYETIEQSPPGLEARRLLVQHYMACGCKDAAKDAIHELLLLDSDDDDVQAWSIMLSQTENAPEPGPTTRPRRQAPKTIIPMEDLESARAELSEGYQALSRNAKMLHWEMQALRGLLEQSGQPVSFARDMPDVEALAGGIISHTESGHLPKSARQIARAMENKPVEAMDIAIEDLTSMAQWLQLPANQPSRSPAAVAPAAAPDKDAVREALTKRVQALVSALPLGLQPHASSAQMHVEHEVLNRTYVLSETMLGSPVSAIPRSKFWVSEDGYPWDMEELAQCITSSGGVMRNPLSREVFTADDIRAIVNHPLGKGLGALAIEQSQLRKGVRPKTIELLENMAHVLGADDSMDQLPSRHVIDDFLAYVATLPAAEQKAINDLRVPARDSHTGQAFDSTIGEAVRDAQGNRVCIHKTGDFIGQAATHLRQSR